MTYRQDCGTFTSFSINFPPKNAQEEFYGRTKKQRRLQRYQNYLDFLVLQGVSCVTCSCSASAYIPLSCRFREQYAHLHEHQVYSEELLM